MTEPTLAAAERLDRALRGIRSTVSKHFNSLAAYIDREAERCSHYPHGSSGLYERLRQIELVREDLNQIETVLHRAAARRTKATPGEPTAHEGGRATPGEST